MRNVIKDWRDLRKRKRSYVHIVVVRDGMNTKLYINGEVRAASDEDPVTLETSVELRP